MTPLVSFGRQSPFRLIGDGSVRQLNVNDFYTLGKQCEVVSEIIGDNESETPLPKLIWPLFWTRHTLVALLSEPCALVPSSKRAAEALVNSISSVIPTDLDEIFALDKEQVKRPWELAGVVSSIKRFETVLSNDMPEMSTFAVNQIGIFRTDALIDKAYMQISEPLRDYLMDLARDDINEAGKCLAFRVSTASAFHLSRAIETGMDNCYYVLTGREFAEKESNRNWGKKTEALVDAGAALKITEFLTHIRKAYRNPITHPNQILDEHEALNFFGPAMSAISMMLMEVKRLMDTNQTPLLEGLTLDPEEVVEGADADALGLLPPSTDPLVK
jgi:hypothetical protein